MKTLHIISLLAAVAMLAGCAAPTPKEVAAARFGVLPDNYQDSVKGFMSTQLKDPYSAVYRFDPARKGWCQDGLIQGGKKHFGWMVPVWVNAKNSFGGYVGERRYYFLFYDGMIADASYGFNANMAGFIK